MIDTTKPGAAPTALLHHLHGGACLTLDQVEQELGITRRQAINAASRLLRREYLMKMAVGCYQLTDRGVAAANAGEVITSGPKGPTGVIATHRGTFRERAWLAMRITRRFTIGQIVAAAARDTEKNARENTRKYLVQLCRAGFVKELPNRVPGTSMGSNGFKRYMLLRNTGPRPPVYRAEFGMMHDFNTGEDVPCTPR
ncbi:MAG TPA: hypothetical protein DC061_15070 [Gemmobacter sp.]|nr:hypothetical protein [Gemmobacter sp.]